MLVKFRDQEYDLTKEGLLSSLDLLEVEFRYAMMEVPRGNKRQTIAANAAENRFYDTYLFMMDAIKAIFAEENNA